VDQILRERFPIVTAWARPSGTLSKMADASDRPASHRRVLQQPAKGAVMPLASIEGLNLMARIRMEFVEMPGMRLTRPQARRLWNLDQAACDGLLDALVEEGFLKQTADGALLRQHHGRPTAAIPRDCSNGPGAKRC
jgi:hypothetical protein